MTFQEFQKQNFNYTCITTFWDDFTIADHFGTREVQDTFDTALNEWKHDYKYITELAIVTNHKAWQHYHQKNTQLSDLYSELYHKVRQFAAKNMSKKEFNYFYRITD